MIYEGVRRERIDVATALRLMIKQIAGLIQILPGSGEEVLRARLTVISSITWSGEFCTELQYPLTEVGLCGFTAPEFSSSCFS